MSVLSGIRDFFSSTWTLQSRKVDFFSHFNASGMGIHVNLMTVFGRWQVYKKCSPILTVIDRLSTAITNGHWSIVDLKGDPSTKYPQLENLMQKPNLMQSWSDFFIQLDTFKYLYGQAYIYAVVPVGMDKTKTASLWVADPQSVEAVWQTDAKLYYASELKQIIKEYRISLESQTIAVEPEHVLSIIDKREDMNNRQVSFTGESRLNSLEKEIKIVMQAQEAILELNTDRGAMGILTNKKRDQVGSIAMTPEEKADLHNEYRSKFGITKGRHKVMITEADVNWQAMTFSIKDLMLYEGIKECLERIFDTFNYPFELMSNSKDTTFANKNEAKKFLYQDNIIPAAQKYAEIFTTFFGLTDAKFKVDFSHVECLQEGIKERNEAKRALAQTYHTMFQNGIITREEYRKEMGMAEQILGSTFVTDETRTGNSVRITQS